MNSTGPQRHSRRPPGLHRLNRTEYANVVRDLLDLNIDAAKYLPSDDSTAGFDNSIKLWELAPDGSMKEKKELKGHTGPVYAVAFHPTSPVLVRDFLAATARVTKSLNA